MGKLLYGLLYRIRVMFGLVLVRYLVIPLLIEFRGILLRVLSGYFIEKFGMGDVESEDIARIVIRLVFREVELFIERRYGVVIDLDWDGV